MYNEAKSPSINKEVQLGIVLPERRELSTAAQLRIYEAVPNHKEKSIEGEQGKRRMEAGRLETAVEEEELAGRAIR